MLEIDSEIKHRQFYLINIYILGLRNPWSRSLWRQRSIFGMSVYILSKYGSDEQLPLHYQKRATFCTSNYDVRPGRSPL